jgi:hypothetical protein
MDRVARTSVIPLKPQMLARGLRDPDRFDTDARRRERSQPAPEVRWRVPFGNFGRRHAPGAANRAEEERRTGAG